MWGAIIGGALGLIQGSRNRRAAREAEDRARADARRARRESVDDQAKQFERLVAAAKKGGFNPLSVLRANPDAGMVNATPALASQAFVDTSLTDAFQTAFNALPQKTDAEKDMLEKELMRAELANMQKQGKALESAMQFGYAIPQANNYSGVDRANSTPDLANLSGVAGGHVPVGLHVNGITVSEANASNAEDWEKRYGDVASSVIGGGLLALDAGQTTRKYWDRFWMEQITNRRQNEINGTHWSGGKVPTRSGSVGRGLQAAMDDDYRAIYGGY